MISDFVKGKSKYNYPGQIQKGIHLHRLIDEFTDIHAATARAKNYFRPQYRLYSGAFVDVVYDHFLAIDESQFKSYGGIIKFFGGGVIDCLIIILILFLNDLKKCFLT